jgi:hypothetical protein
MRFSVPLALHKLILCVDEERKATATTEADPSLRSG